MNPLDRAVRKGLLPDWMLRLGIRRLLRTRLRQEGGDGLEEAQRRHMRHVDMLRRSSIAQQVEAANEQHYEVPAAFYERVLGPHRKYSCGYWTDETTSLTMAEEAMLRLTVERAGIRDGLRVLDLGCGWGALSLWIAEHFPRCEVLGVSNSHSQREHILSEAHRRGLDNLRIVTADVNDFAPEETFDRVVSVEMFEHVRNHEALLARIAAWLEPDGKLFVHVFVHQDHAYTFETEGNGNWMGRQFFTGGQMPSDRMLLYFQRDLAVTKHWRVNGRHYAKTARAWLENLDAAKADLVPLLAPTDREGDGRAALNAWRVFFMACEELWGYERGDTWFVAHYLFEPVARPARGRLRRKNLRRPTSRASAA